jgi:hypothetical protein
VSEARAVHTSRAFRLVWNGRVVAEFEAATGLDPWGRLLTDVKDKVAGDIQDALRAAVAPGLPYRQGASGHMVRFERGEVMDPGFRAWASHIEEGAADDSPAGDSITFRSRSWATRRSSAGILAPPMRPGHVRGDEGTAGESCDASHGGIADPEPRRVVLLHPTGPSIGWAVHLHLSGGGGGGTSNVATVSITVIVG